MKAKKNVMRGHVIRVVAMSLIFFTVFALCKFVFLKKEDSTETFSPEETLGESELDPNANPNSNLDPNKKRVAITYDDGPHNVRTKAIVDELAKYGYRATFFVVGNRVDGSEYAGGSAVKYAASKGNEIAIHAYTHSIYYTDESKGPAYKAEIVKTYNAIKGVVPDAKVKLMRPTGGEITEEGIRTCQYSVIQWDVDSEDWKYKYDGEEGVKTIVNNVMSRVQNGSIILMHDIYENTYLATQEILKQLNEQGYEVVTVSELLGNPKAGVEYISAR